MYIISRDAPLCDRVWKNSDDGKLLDAFSSYKRFHLLVLKVDFQRFDSCILQDIYPVLLSVANLKNWKKKNFRSSFIPMSSPWILIPGENEQMHAVLMTSIFSISHQSLIKRTKLTPQKGNNNKKATTKQPKKKTKTFFFKEIALYL